MTADIRTAAQRGHVEAHKKCCGGKGYCRECFERWPCPSSAAAAGLAEGESGV